MNTGKIASGQFPKRKNNGIETISLGNGALSILIHSELPINECVVITIVIIIDGIKQRRLLKVAHIA
jgi:hypothetical protein